MLPQGGAPDAVRRLGHGSGVFRYRPKEPPFTEEGVWQRGWFSSRPKGPNPSGGGFAKGTEVQLFAHPFKCGLAQRGL